MSRGEAALAAAARASQRDARAAVRIALKFYRGHDQEHRRGYEEVGLVAQLLAIRARQGEGR